MCVFCVFTNLTGICHSDWTSVSIVQSSWGLEFFLFVGHFVKSTGPSLPPPSPPQMQLLELIPHSIQTSRNSKLQETNRRIFIMGLFQISPKEHIACKTEGPASEAGFILSFLHSQPLPTSLIPFIYFQYSLLGICCCMSFTFRSLVDDLRFLLTLFHTLSITRFRALLCTFFS